MSKEIYMGVDNKARRVKDFYIGVDGVARKVKKAYIGDNNGKARQFWSSEILDFIQVALPITYITCSAFLNGRFWIFGPNDSGTAGMGAYSTDAINWTTFSTPVSHPRAIAYGGGKYVAIAYDYLTENIAMYSSNGINWYSSSVSDSINYWSDICYGNGKFVAVSKTGSIAYSTSGMGWTIAEQPSNFYNDLNTVEYGDGHFVAIKDTNNVNYVGFSSDGINWEAKYYDSFGLESLVYNEKENLFYGISSNNYSPSNSYLIRFNFSPNMTSITTNLTEKCGEQFAIGQKLVVIKGRHNSNLHYRKTGNVGSNIYKELISINSWFDFMDRLNYGNGIFLATASGAISSDTGVGFYALE